jgi:hypothetical protein
LPTGHDDPRSPRPINNRFANLITTHRVQPLPGGRVLCRTNLDEEMPSRLEMLPGVFRQTGEDHQPVLATIER